MNTQQIEEMGCEEEIDVDDMAMVEGQLLPPVAPALPPVDLRALAGQLPDLSNLDNLTVNIQANTFALPPADSQQITALAQDTEARLGHLRGEIKHALE
jgi:hypothetical protein